MSTIELKADLNRLIQQEEDEQMLLTIRKLLKQDRSAPIEELGGQTIEEFNGEMADAEREIDDGEFSTQEEVTTRFEKLFSR